MNIMKLGAVIAIMYEGVLFSGTGSVGQPPVPWNEKNN
jgi:hypothetical protein